MVFCLVENSKNYKSTSLHVPTLEGPLVMISLLNAEMATVESLLECRSKTWEEWCSKFSSNGCKDQCRHWEYVTAGASLSWIIQSCMLLLVHVYEQKVHCSTQMILKLHFVYCMRFIVILIIVVRFITTTKMRGHYLICFVEISMNDYDFSAARWILMQKM